MLSLPELRRSCSAVCPCREMPDRNQLGASRPECKANLWRLCVSRPTPNDHSFYNPTSTLCLPGFSDPGTCLRILQGVVPRDTGPDLIGKWRGGAHLVKCRFLNPRDLLNQEGLGDSGSDEHPSAYWHHLSSEGPVALHEGSHTSHHLVHCKVYRTK